MQLTCTIKNNIHLRNLKQALNHVLKDVLKFFKKDGQFQEKLIKLFGLSKHRTELRRKAKNYFEKY